MKNIIWSSRTQIFKKCNTIANICVGLDVNILHCVEGLEWTDPLVLPCVLNVTPYLKSAIDQWGLP